MIVRNSDTLHVLSYSSYHENFMLLFNTLRRDLISNPSRTSMILRLQQRVDISTYGTSTRRRREREKHQVRGVIWLLLSQSLTTGA